jgi:hypothetical protein
MDSSWLENKGRADIAVAREPQSHDNENRSSDVCNAIAFGVSDIAGRGKIK